MLIPRRKLLLGAAAGIFTPAIVHAQTLNMLGSGSSAKVSAGGGTVSVDAVGSEAFNNSGLTSFDYTGITVGSGTNRALAILIVFDLAGVSTSPTGITAIWDSGGTNQSMTQIVSRSISGAGTGPESVIFGLAAPTSGNKTLHVAWTNNSGYQTAAISFTGVNQTGGTTSFPNAVFDDSATSGSISTVTVTSATGDKVICCSNCGSIFTLTGTTIYTDAAHGAFINSFANYDTGAASVIIGNTASGSGSIVACDVKAA